MTDEGEDEHDKTGDAIVCVWGGGRHFGVRLLDRATDNFFFTSLQISAVEK